ncbi:MAG: prepilin-type N-terminal cleavage/methylation domain-containing protein [Phycisphaerae bacterium]|nr:prepilin-type N-terminal cleavage/methylation domain-containing protein [Phycisphaerae bacterium]
MNRQRSQSDPYSCLAEHPLRQVNPTIRQGLGGAGLPRCHRYAPPGRGKGFTLIELLVVIAILSLLVSILLPSLQKAKLLARQVLCLTRLKAIGSAYYLYRNDNHDKGPVGFTYGWDEHARNWPTPNWSDYPDNNTRNPYKDNKEYGWFRGRRELDDGTPCWALGEYLGVIRGDRKTIVATCCPNWFDWYMDGIHTTKDTSYAVNWFLGRETHLGDHIVKSTASTPMLMDGMGENFEHEGELQPYYTVFPRVNYPSEFSDLEFISMTETSHEGSANYLLFDGHAESHKAPDIDISGGTGPYLEYFNTLWTWYGD